MTEQKQRLMRDIADKLCIEVNTITNSKQLLDALMEKEKKREKDKINQNIPQPDIRGMIENVGKIILPPDIKEIITGSGKGRDQKERPVGFDKIGLMEAWLSHKLGKERESLHRKEGILRNNQMRKVSYYHIYIPEMNKTLLLNNQYGEGVFLIEGDFLV